MALMGITLTLKINNYADRDAFNSLCSISYQIIYINTILKTSIDVTGYSDSPEWSLVYNRSAFNSVDYVVLFMTKHGLRVLQQVL